MMSLNNVLLFVLLLGIITSIVFAQAFHLTRKDKTQKELQQEIIVTRLRFLGVVIGLFSGFLLIGDGSSYTSKEALLDFLLIVTIFPIAWLIVRQVKKRQLL